MLATKEENTHRLQTTYLETDIGYNTEIAIIL